MAGIPTNFQAISPVLSSYDWLDITSGCGYRRYYACSSDVAGITYFLSARELDAPSRDWYIQANINVGAAAKIIDLDFDIEFKVPAVIYGDAFINLTYAVTTQANVDSTYVVIRVYHVTSGGVETEIGTSTTDTKAWGAAVPYYHRECVKVALSKKHFAKTDKLRLTVEGWGGDNTGGKMIIYHDPTSSKTYSDFSDSRTIGTNLIFDCPFQVNL
jgi:hypothetical protein